MKRPVGVVLTAVLLGFLAALQLLGMAFMTLTGFLTLHGMPNGQTSPVPPAFLPILFFGMSFVCDAIAVWLILTLVGLIRLRSWARYSVLVAGGLMAGFGAISAVTSAVMPFLVPNQSGADPRVLHITFFVIAAVYALFALLGVVLLVYYNFPTTQALFLQNQTTPSTPPNTSTGRPRPTAVTVISWMYLIGGPFCLLYTLLPMPTFLMGFILTGAAARLVYAGLGGISLAIGYGLLRLRNSARIAVIWWSALCPVNLVVLLTPWGKRRYNEYMDLMNAFNTRFLPAQAAPSPNLATSPAFLIFVSVVVIAGIGVVLWFLHRHRAAFTPLTEPAMLEPAAG